MLLFSLLLLKNEFVWDIPSFDSVGCSSLCILPCLARCSVKQFMVIAIIALTPMILDRELLGTLLTENLSRSKEDVLQITNF